MNEQTTAQEKQSWSKAVTVRRLFEERKKEIAMALPRHMDADRMVRIAMTACQKTPELLECHAITLLGAVIQAAQLGLEPNDGTGKAWLIPFHNSKKNRKEVQFIPGYRGLIHLARNSGQIKRFDARVVKEKDHFDYEYGAHPRLVHKPFKGDEGGGGGRTVFVYAVAEFHDGGIQFEVMTKGEVDAIRKRSKAATTGPWVSDYDEMAKKTAARKLCKYLPANSELQRAVELDERVELGVPQDLGILADVEEQGTPPALGQDAVPDPQAAAATTTTTATATGADGGGNGQAQPEQPATGQAQRRK